MKRTIKRYNLLPVIFCLILLAHGLQLNAAKHVTVATIGGRPHEIDKSKGMQNAVDQVVNFWSARLKQVLPDKPDLIVLPENCDYPGGLSAEEKAEYRRVRKNQIKDFLASIAKENSCYIAFGTVVEIKNGGWYNTCIVLDRNGNVAGSYNKNFPTIGEMKAGIKAGTETPLIKTDFGTIGCAICYDLNFPELMNSYAALKPDIIVFPSMYHGGLVQEYWAFACRSFFIGSCGFREIPSEIRNPLGEVVASSTNYFDYAVARINLDRRSVHLDENWGKLTSLKNKYGPVVTINDPSKLGSVLVTSEDKNITADQMIKEFGIELLDDYFNRSRKFRQETGIVR